MGARVWRIAACLGLVAVAGLRAEGTLWRIFTETGQRAAGRGDDEVAVQNLQAALEEAQARAEEATAESIYTLALSHTHLGEVLARARTLAEARSHFQRAILLMEQTEGKSERDLLVKTLQRYGLVLRRAGELKDARDAFERALELSQAALARGESDAMAVVDGLVRTYLLEEQRQPAEHLLRRSIATLEKDAVKNRLQIARLLGDLGDLYEVGGRPNLAEALYRRAVELYERAGVRQGEELARALVRRARMDSRAQDADSAAAGFRRALELFRSLGNTAGFEMGEALSAQARMRFAAGEFERTIELARESLEVLGGSKHPRRREITLENYRLLARAHRDSGKFEHAESLFKRMLQLYGRRPDVLPGLMVDYAQLLERMGRAREAGELRSRAARPGHQPEAEGYSAAASAVGSARGGPRGP